MNYFAHESAAERYARSRPDFLQRWIVASIESICELARSVPTALDVGCGTGQSSVPLLKIAERVVGTDTSAEMLAHAINDQSVVYVRAPAEQLPFEEGTFDLVTAGLAFHWFDRERFLDEARRVLSPSGWLVIYNNWFCGEMEENSEFARWFREEHLERYPSPPRNSAPLPESAFAERGFAIVEREEYEKVLPMSAKELVDYLLTQTNVIAAVEGGAETIESITRRVSASMESLFPRARASFLFGGSAMFVQICRHRAPR